MRRILCLSFLDRYREYGAVFIRAIVGYRLVHGTIDNVTSSAQMVEFAEFLQAQGFPWPLFNAYLSAYAQFIAGVLIVAGAFTRPAALVMIVNFSIALLMVHVGLPFLENFDALVMLFGSAFLLLHGAGALSVDGALESRASAAESPGTPRRESAPG